MRPVVIVLLDIEGHTDSKPYPPAATYTNWELSADRANAARRLMQQNGIRSDQITQVRGFTDQRLRKPETSLDPSNRRISLIVPYKERKPGTDETGEQKPEAEAGAEKSQKVPDGKEERIVREENSSHASHTRVRVSPVFYSMADLNSLTSGPE